MLLTPTHITHMKMLCLGCLAYLLAMKVMQIRLKGEARQSDIVATPAAISRWGDSNVKICRNPSANHLILGCRV